MEPIAARPINVAVFIDYENVYRTLLENHTNVLHEAFFEKLRKWCENKQRRIVKIAVYCNFDNFDLHESYHQTVLQNYGVETVHTSNQGKNYADLQITIDVLTSIYSNNNIDEFFIMSNDKDMIPLLNTIRANKRNVSIITTGTNFNHSVIEFADSQIKFEEICSTDIDHKIIDDITEAYWDKLYRYISKQIAEAEGGKFTHYELNYALQNEIRYSKVMSYELAEIIKGFYDNSKVFFYNYDYKSKPCVGMAPVDLKSQMISKRLIKETGIITNYNIQSIIDSFYTKATGKPL